MTPQTKPRKRRERLLLRVVKGALEPADGYTASRLRDKGYRIGDQVLVELFKPRNPVSHRIAHRLGQLVAENIDEFAGVEAHDVLKRIQIEANIACDEVLAHMDIMGQRIKINQRIPRSLSFASMDDGEFRETFRAFSTYIAAEYWPELTAEQVESMAELMVEAV